MSDRGGYCSIRRVLLDGPDFQRLPARARWVFVALKLSMGPAGIDVFYPAALVSELAAKTGLSEANVSGALEELDASGWVVREHNVVWAVGHLKNDPHMHASDEKHRKAIAKHLGGLPRLAIVTSFIADHPEFFPPIDSPIDMVGRAIEGPSKGHRSKEKEKERETKTEKETEADRASAAPPPSSPSSSTSASPVCDDPVTQLLSDHDFGPFATAIEGICRSARHPASVIATLRMHIAGEMGHERGTPLEVGLAAQQFLADGGGFNARYFAGFVRGAKRGVERVEARKRNAAEDRFIDADRERRAREAEEERKSMAALQLLEEHEPERFAELQKRAAAGIPPSITFGRDEMLRARLIHLLRETAA